MLGKGVQFALFFEKYFLVFKVSMNVKDEFMEFKIHVLHFA